MAKKAKKGPKTKTTSKPLSKAVKKAAKKLPPPKHHGVGCFDDKEVIKKYGWRLVFWIVGSDMKNGRTFIRSSLENLAAELRELARTTSDGSSIQSYNDSADAIQAMIDGYDET